MLILLLRNWAADYFGCARFINYLAFSLVFVRWVHDGSFERTQPQNAANLGEGVSLGLLQTAFIDLWQVYL